MPQESLYYQLKFLPIKCCQDRVDEAETTFLEDLLLKQKCPESNEYNTANGHEQGQSIQPKTKAMYLPLIDITPSDPDTIIMSLVQVQKFMLQTGQQFVIFTCDLQLYHMALQIQWTYPDRFSNVVIDCKGCTL